MGSGELTETMVEVHKALLRPYGTECRAVFLDTPAGFQVNVDLISQKAVEYFKTRIRHPLSVASFKSANLLSRLDTGRFLDRLNHADYLFMGPGSPTYALRQWHSSPVPEIMVERLKSGACLVASSAAALTMGRVTLPVYEIYKVGQDPFWVDGLDITGHFGWNLAVVPHWNNQEGGNHDTRFCFMGEQRLISLEKQLSENTAILGIDEHTAVIIDMEKRTVDIKGRGTTVLRWKGHTRIFKQGDSLPFEEAHFIIPHVPEKENDAPDQDTAVKSELLKNFQILAGRIAQNPATANADIQQLQEIEERIRRQHESDSIPDPWDTVCGIYRELLLSVSRARDEMPGSDNARIAPLVDAVIDLRDRLRERQEWQTADAIRDCLKQVNVIVTDTADGTRWHRYQ
jgi:peptidase E